jgi:hypothetical protein
MSTKLSIWSCTTKDKTAVYICQIVPQKLVYSSRFQWTPVDSDGFQGIIRIQAYSIGFLWNPTYSTRFQRIPVDSVLVKFIPSDSSGFHWIPEDTKDSMEVQSGCVWKSEVQKLRLMLPALSSMTKSIRIIGQDRRAGSTLLSRLAEVGGQEAFGAC